MSEIERTLHEILFRNRLKKSNSYYIYYWKYLEIISTGKISDASTIYSLNSKDIDSDEVKNNTNFTLENKKDKYKLFHCRSSIFIRNNLIHLPFESTNEKKCFSSCFRLNKKISPNNININKINKFKLNKININFVNKKELQNRENSKNKNNINSASIPVNTTKYKTISKTYKEKIKIQKNKIDIYSQNKDISCMKKSPPKLPEIMEHCYNLKNKNALYTNKTYGKIINPAPISFYNHLMISENSKNSYNKRNNYFKTSFTQRNKKKMLTIVYYYANQ